MTQLDEDFTQVAPIDALVLVLVEKLENFDELFVLLCLLDSLSHKVAKLIEVNLATLVVISVFHHLRDFLLGWVLTE